MVEFDIVRLSPSTPNTPFDCGIIDYIKLLFIQSNKTGCRFITVDAHHDAVGFYEKCGFAYFTETDAEDDTRLMYFDLKPFRDACFASMQ